MLGRRLGVAAPLSAAVFAAGLLFASGDKAAASDFSGYLAEGYHQLASTAGKSPAAQLYKKRSAASAAGQTLEPLQPDSIKLEDLTLGEAQEARDKLMEALQSGGRERQPLLAAIAQVNYDCWIAPLPKRKGAPRSIDCHSRFLLAFDGLPDKHRHGPISSVEPWQFAGSATLPDIHSATQPIAGNGDSIGSLIRVLSAPSMPKRAASFDAALASVYDVGQTPLDNAVVGSCDTNCQQLEFSGPGTAPLIAALRADKNFQGPGNSKSGQQNGISGSGPGNNGPSSGATGGSAGSGGSAGGSPGGGSPGSGGLGGLGTGGLGIGGLGIGGLGTGGLGTGGPGTGGPGAGGPGAGGPGAGGPGAGSPGAGSPGAGGPGAGGPSAGGPGAGSPGSGSGSGSGDGGDGDGGNGSGNGHGHHGHGGGQGD